jgi:RNA polymerase sigma-70 factor (ECF subfamily)
MGDNGERQPDKIAPGIFRENYGFIPALFRAQNLLPHLVEAEAALADAILFQKTGLPRVEKESIVLAEAVAEASPYCVALQSQTLVLLGLPKQKLSAILSAPDQIEFSPTLDSALALAWASFVRTMAAGLSVTPDFEPPQLAGDRVRGTLARRIAIETHNDMVGGTFFQEQFGLIPNLFRIQASRPRVVEAEAKLMAAVLSPDSLLARRQVEQLLLYVSAAERNEYGTALWGKNHTGPADQVLVDFAVKLATRTQDFTKEDCQGLRESGFQDEGIVAAVAATALGKFLNTLQICLQAVPDFPVPALRWTVPENNANLLPEQPRPTDECAPVDSDLAVVEAVRGGDVDAFEQLIERHSRRVYRTLVGILSDPEDARDAMQDTFLKAFQHLGNFQARSKFSTWLISIATNTGIQRLRERRSLESLDDSGPDSDENFRPRQIRAWVDDPEQLYSQTQRRELVEGCVQKLPAKYRVAVVLRDLELLTTEEAAAALGLEIPTLKTRLLRGRMMLREALAPHFTRRANEVARD